MDRLNYLDISGLLDLDVSVGKGRRQAAGYMILEQASMIVRVEHTVGNRGSQGRARGKDSREDSEELHFDER